MKRLSLTFSILLSFTQIQAQVVFNRAYHDVSEEPNPFLITINSEIYFTTQDKETSDYPYYFLYKHDASATTAITENQEAKKTEAKVEGSK